VLLAHSFAVVFVQLKRSCINSVHLCSLRKPLRARLTSGVLYPVPSFQYDAFKLIRQHSLLCRRACVWAVPSPAHCYARTKFDLTVSSSVLIPEPEKVFCWLLHALRGTV